MEIKEEPRRPVLSPISSAISCATTVEEDDDPLSWPLVVYGCASRRRFRRLLSFGHVIVPEPGLLVLPLDHAIDVERVDERDEEVAVLLVTGPRDLRHAVAGQVDLGALGQPAARVAYVEQNAVGQHETRLEHIEKPLVPHDGADAARIKVRGPKVDVGDIKVLDHSVNGPHRDDSAADVQRRQRVVDLGRADSVSVALNVEVAGQGDEKHNDDNLNQQRGLEKRLSSVPLGFWQRLVRRVCRAVAVKRLDHHGYRGKGCEDTTRMNRRVIWNEVKDSTQDIIVAQLIQRPKLPGQCFRTINGVSRIVDSTYGAAYTKQMLTMYLIRSR